MPSQLLICESPGKIKKLKQILGSNWNVKASFGHVVELANDGADSLGFTLDERNNRIDCHYVPRGSRGKQVLKDLREAVKQAAEIFIATDPDREGETIGWHLAQQLRLKNPQRVVYTEITDQAVRQAIAHPRPLDLNLVAAGRCRDTLDKLVGYKGSPLLWNLNNGAKSMGRVQSATMHILCVREREIKAFVPQDYWSVFVDYADSFRAYYAGTAVIPQTQTESEQRDDASESKDQLVESVRVLSQSQALQLIAIARENTHRVVRVEATTTTRKPPAPFTTSSLQQAAGSRLKFGSERTMKVAQALYEQGHITYMRTDSVALSQDYCQQARQWLEQHDPQNVPQQVTTQKSKAGAQEAHEAIRPTHVENTPESLGASLSEEEAKLYCLIWGRAIASQCQPAQLQQTRIVTQSGCDKVTQICQAVNQYLATPTDNLKTRPDKFEKVSCRGTVFWQARGQVVTFRGYTVYWNDISSDSQLPIVKQGQQLTLLQADSQKKQTQPPLRYTEPKLVQMMEKLGIGRPSTYAPTCKVLRFREYASLVKGHLQPTQLGMDVDEFLMRVLTKMVEPEFTAEMESALDDVASGKQQWERYLINWNQTYFAPALQAAYQSLGTSPSVEEGQKRRTTRSGQIETGLGVALDSSRASGSFRQAALTEIHCPKCEWLMQKIPCRSQKLKADHFLKCSNQDCGAAMFWSDLKQAYELPYSEHKNSLSTPTRNSRPVSSGKSNELQNDNNVAPLTAAQVPMKTTGNKKLLKPKQNSTSSFQEASTLQNTIDYPCPVCDQPLELYKYTKGNEQKQMLRCSDAQARRQDDHLDVAYFASRGVFWSPKYGEVGKHCQ